MKHQQCGQSILDRFDVQEVARLHASMQQSVGARYMFSEEDLVHELQMADQNEALRLIASAYRENIIGQAEDCRFIVCSDETEHTLFDAASALRFRSDLKPKKRVSIFLLENSRRVELLGADGVLMVLMKYFGASDPMQGPAAQQRLLYASRESVRNEAMALTFMKAWYREIAETISEVGDVFIYLDSLDSYVFFNRLSAFPARSLMPFSKMRLTLSAQEVLDFAPEFCPQVPIQFAAVLRSKMRLSCSADYADFDQALVELYPAIYAAWSAALESRDLEPGKYVLFPFHPLNRKWMELHAPSVFAKSEFVFLDGIEAPSVPSLSFRSMLLDSHCVKLPVPIQTTHLSRNIPVAEIKNGPLFSDVLQKIIDKEGLHDQLTLERDLAGAYLDFERAGCEEDISTMFGFVMRQNPVRQIDASEHVVPVSAMFLPMPTQKVPFFLSIMEKGGARNSQAQYDYFASYVKLVVATQLNLYFRSGIMLEAHQQNLNLVYDHHWALKKLMYHDIPGGLSGFTPLLTSRYEIPEGMLHKIYKFKNTPERSILQFAHPTLVAHLIPLVITLDYCLGLDRRKLRDIIRAEIEAQIQLGRSLEANTQQEADARKQLLDRFEQQILLNKTLPAKKLLSAFYSQAKLEDWGIKFPNTPADMVSVMGSEIENFLVA